MLGKNGKDNSNREWTSFEFVQHLIKYPDTPDDTFLMMYENLLGEDNLEKDMEDYWELKVVESIIDQEEFGKIKKAFNQRFEKIRKLDQTKKDADDIAKWAVTNTDNE
ncbi:MAG: hypothetical protein NZ747_06755 [Nitrosopumilus sp.]|nr:hypothetical protein [Nitrosopumilus sp.]